ncbi:type II toxin-antitoxin system VapC family toxin [Polyangium sp. 6x1]|uniref:type II toxin-antitoxin system VapC family toxin n=1 Tax=Polyangium sp. 6x1 TaxID=3042689 RepID=UPI002482C348|nr:type II toxin-antitoxin system VapC family toxin [Polyangium sp. 6x1]MDI1442904.1 type II toxin-antitoxin system VapC family toxin [Polyangium sp. 6x1]
MKLLLDTCALLWLAVEPERFSRDVRDALVACRGELHVSAISALEIAIKVAKRRLELPLPPEAWFPRVVDRYRLREVPVDSAIAARSARVGLDHADPADRIVVTTAILLDMTVLTSDQRIRSFQAVRSLW